MQEVSLLSAKKIIQEVSPLKYIFQILADQKKYREMITNQKLP